MSQARAPQVVFDASVEEALARSRPVAGWRDHLRHGRWETLWTGWGVSAVLHLVLVLVLAALLMPIHLGERGTLKLETSMLESEQTPLETFTMSAEDGGVEFVGLEDDTFSDLVDETMMPIADPFGGRASGSDGAESASAGPRGGFGGQTGPQAEFFGTVARGDRFVYVMDISGSMSSGTRGNPKGGSRFRRASEELLRSIDQLRDDQYFYVVLFSFDTLRMLDDNSPLPQMLPATYENKLKLRTWLHGIKPGGGTDPRVALRLGLQMKPSALFLLSDGDFNGRRERSRRSILAGNPTVPEVVEQNNAGQSPIHTVAYEDESGRNRMYTLSTQTGGLYRYVAPSANAKSTTGRSRAVAQTQPAQPSLTPAQRAEALLRLAEKLDSTGNRKKAVDRYREIIKEFPASGAAAEARKRMPQTAADRNDPATAQDR